MRARILIADDEQYAAQTLQHLLEARYLPEVVHSGREALDRLRADRGFAVVICDLMMPDLTGMDLHEALQEEAPEYLPRLVFITGGAFTPRSRAFLDAVDNEVLEKPYTYATVEAAIERVLGRAGETRPGRPG